jgi:hypothetical protein
MPFQGISRTSPPFCHGNGAEHCCWVDGQVCQFLTENDSRAVDGRRWSCGLVLDFQDQFPQFDLRRLWERVHRHPLYEEIVQSVWDRVGVAPCGDFLGGTLPDGTIVGQCCFEGFVFDADGNVMSGPG